MRLEREIRMFVFFSLIATLLSIGQVDAIGWNSISWNPYSGNYCLSFDGNDYASCSSMVYRASALTIQLWVKPNYTIQVGSQTSYGRQFGAIISGTASWVGPDTGQGGWALFFDFSDGHLYFKYRSASIMYIEIYTVGTNRDLWNSSSWYNIAVTYSASAGLAFYVNQTVDKTTPSDGKAIAYDTNELRVGGYSTSDYMFQGLIDEVRLWSVSKTYADISDSWRRVLNGTECNSPDLVGYWRFDEGAGTESKDFSPQGINMSLGSPPYDPTWIAVPEFPSVLILPLFMTVTLLAVIISRRRLLVKLPHSTSFH